MVARIIFICLIAAVWVRPAKGAQELRLSRAEYADRVRAAWTGQILGTLMGFPYEHKPASTVWIDRFPRRYDQAPPDDDYYYELVALRAFEKYGPALTVQQLGRQWAENAAGSWGSSEQTRLLLRRGIVPPDTGHPRYNKLWFTIGPQFSGDIYGMLAPGMPNVAARLARDLGHINGYAEGTDGGVFIAGMVSLGFSEDDSRTIVRKAARLIHPASPYRQCLELVISMADSGSSFRDVARAVEDRWHIEYPATNNAVANGGLVAASVWFGGGDFLKSLNLAFQAADFTDADCNAADAGAVVGAMRGMKGLPTGLVEQLSDRIAGEKMGGVTLTPPVNETITGVARRIAETGEKMLSANGARVERRSLAIPLREVETQPAELFRLADLMRYWNPEWQLEGAGFGGAGGGLGGVRGITFLDGDVLATYPRDEVRGLLLRRRAKISVAASVRFEAGVDAGRAWQLEMYANNERLLTRIVDGEGEGRQWQNVAVDLGRLAGQEVELRVYQLVLVPNRVPGTAYWRKIRVE